MPIDNTFGYYPTKPEGYQPTIPDGFGKHSAPRSDLFSVDLPNEEDDVLGLAYETIPPRYQEEVLSSKSNDVVHTEVGVGSFVGQKKDQEYIQSQSVSEPRIIHQNTTEENFVNAFPDTLPDTLPNTLSAMETIPGVLQEQKDNVISSLKDLDGENVLAEVERVANGISVFDVDQLLRSHDRLRVAKYEHCSEDIGISLEKKRKIVEHGVTIWSNLLRGTELQDKMALFGSISEYVFATGGGVNSAVLKRLEGTKREVRVPGDFDGALRTKKDLDQLRDFLLYASLPPGASIFFDVKVGGQVEHVSGNILSNYREQDYYKILDGDRDDEECYALSGGIVFDEGGEKLMFPFEFFSNTIMFPDSFWEKESDEALVQSRGIQVLTPDGLIATYQRIFNFEKEVGENVHILLGDLEKVFKKFFSTTDIEGLNPEEVESRLLRDTEVGSFLEKYKTRSAWAVRLYTQYLLCKTERDKEKREKLWKEVVSFASGGLKNKTPQRIDSIIRIIENAGLVSSAKNGDESLSILELEKVYKDISFGFEKLVESLKKGGQNHSDFYLFLQECVSGIESGSQDKLAIFLNMLDTDETAKTYVFAVLEETVFTTFQQSLKKWQTLRAA